MTILIIAAAVVLRFVPHPWNVSPLMGLALFSGARLNTRRGVFTLLSILFLSDLFLGFHATMPFTWGSVLLVMVLGRSLRNTGFGAPLLFVSFLGSLLFYLITNLGVFLTGSLYAKTWSGLLECYGMGIPFFRNAVLGDWAYTFLLFGAHHLALRRVSAGVRSA